MSSTHRDSPVAIVPILRAPIGKRRKSPSSRDQLALVDFGVPALAATAVVISALGSLWVYPHSLSYFNLLSGGPTRGYRHLVDSNIDWGQDLPALAAWQRAHPGAPPMRLHYFGSAAPAAYGVQAERIGHIAELLELSQQRVSQIARGTR